VTSRRKNYRIPYVVERRDSGWVVIEQATGSIVTSILPRIEAWVEVWKRNGRHGSIPKSWRRYL
jgi:hypothetical protein